MRNLLLSLAFLSAAAAVGSADTLTLRNGRTVEGQYLGGDSRVVRMAVGDHVNSFQVEEISDLQFGSPQPPPPPPPPPDQQTQNDAPPPPPPPPPPDGDRDHRRDYDRPSAELPAYTSISIRMIDPVDSEKDHLGQTFRASVSEPVVVRGNELIPKGANAVVKLVNDQQSGKFEGRTVLTLDLMQVEVNGRMVDINSLDVTKSSSSRGARTGAVVGGATVLGALIGGIAGGGRGAAIGAGSGAAVGAGTEVLTKGQRVKIPSETRLVFTLQQSTPL
jgi:hypothetical protein